MGVEDIGPDRMIAGAESWGFNDTPPLDLPAVAESAFPTDFTDNIPALAQSAIGQNDVAATPLQMALVAAGVANDGVIMAPHVVAEIRDGEGDVLDRADSDVWRQAVDGPTARTMREGMIGVVERPDGTAGSLAIEGQEVGGKTGTAQLGTDPPRSHAWIIGFAGPPGGPVRGRGGGHRRGRERRQRADRRLGRRSHRPHDDGRRPGSRRRWLSRGATEPVTMSPVPCTPLSGSPHRLWPRDR